MRHEPRSSRTRIRILPLLVLIPMLLTGCIPESFAATPFERESSDAASTLAAAATTIRFLHADKIDVGYARASMIIYRETLAGVESRLPNLRGAPDATVLQPVLDRLTNVRPMLDDPCLADECDWSAQVTTLQQSSDALLELAS